MASEFQKTRQTELGKRYQITRSSEEENESDDEAKEREEGVDEKEETGMETLQLKTSRLLLPLLRHWGEFDQPAHMHELRPASGPLHPVAP